MRDEIRYICLRWIHSADRALDQTLITQPAYIILPVIKDGRKTAISCEFKSVKEFINAYKDCLPSGKVVLDLTALDEDNFKKFREFPNRYKKQRAVFLNRLRGLFSYGNLMFAEIECIKKSRGMAPAQITKGFDLGQYVEANKNLIHPKRVALYCLLDISAHLQLQLEDAFSFPMVSEELSEGEVLEKVFRLIEFHFLLYEGRLAELLTAKYEEHKQSIANRGRKPITKHDLEVLVDIIDRETKSGAEESFPTPKKFRYHCCDMWFNEYLNNPEKRKHPIELNDYGTILEYFKKAQKILLERNASSRNNSPI